MSAIACLQQLIPFPLLSNRVSRHRSNRGTSSVLLKRLFGNLSGRRHKTVPDSVGGLIEPSYTQVIGDYEEIRLHRVRHIPVFDVAANDLESSPIAAGIELGGPVHYAFVVDALHPAIGRSGEINRGKNIANHVVDKSVLNAFLERYGDHRDAQIVGHDWDRADCAGKTENRATKGNSETSHT